MKPKSQAEAKAAAMMEDEAKKASEAKAAVAASVEKEEVKNSAKVAVASLSCGWLLFLFLLFVASVLLFGFICKKVTMATVESYT